MNIIKKHLLAIIILCGLFNIGYAQDKNIKAMADSAVKAFTWDVQKFPKGEMMFIDVPYLHDKKTDYLTITVAKNKSVNRPAFISVIVPANVSKANGIFIGFAKDVKDSAGKRKLEIIKGLTCHLDFEKCDTALCTARIMGGYLVDAETKNKLDEYQHFLTYDHLMFLVVYADGSHKSIAVPLFSFRKQYQTLE
jgi:hypothetical protein